MSLKVIAEAAARHPAPRVTLVRNRTVEKVDRIRGPQLHPVLGRIVEERQQFVLIIGDPLDDLGVLRSVLFG